MKYFIYQYGQLICTYNFSRDAYNFSCEKPRYASLITVTHQKERAKSFIEQTLLEKGLDPAKYRISNSEFNAAIGIAQFPWED
jgi:hypothetical protein